MCRNHENNSIMAHGLHSMIKSEIGCSSGTGKPRVEQRPGGGGSSSSGTAGKMGSRRIFTPQFKLQVLDSYRNDSDCKGNQRATARKYGIHRRQIQKWLQVENNLRSAAANSNSASGGAASAMKINLISNSGSAHQQQHHHHHHLHHHNPHHPAATQPTQPQFQLHPLHHHHIHHQNLNSIELKVPPLDSTRHRVAQNANCGSNNNNNNSTILLNGSSSNSKESSSACIISPVPRTHTAAAPSPFSHPHHHDGSSSSASLSVLKAHSRDAVASQMPRPNFPPVSGGCGVEFPFVPTPTVLQPAYELLEPYYRRIAGHYPDFPIADSPIDLSLPAQQQHQFRSHKLVEQALSPCSTVSSVYSSRPRSSTPFPTDNKREDSPAAADEASSRYEAVDLSCRKRKASTGDDDASDGGPSPPKSVKLFKPYLLDEKSDDKDDKDSSIDSPVTLMDPLRDGLEPSGGRLDYPIIWNFHAQQRYYDSLYEFGSGGQFSYTSSPPYLPHTPIPRTPFSSTLSPSPPSSSSQWAQPQASPVSGYDSSTSISSVYSQDGNDDGYSYSAELKQQAIDSFYHDVSCRGDFRAVASKYNINRKYVEMWLAQEDVQVGSGSGSSSSSQVPAPPPPQVVVG